MDLPFICPKCHAVCRLTDYFCFNCGKNLRPAPLSTSVGKQVLLYLGSVVLPPMGLFWGFPYLRQSGQTAKIVGLTAIILTLLSAYFATELTINYVSSISSQVRQQLPDYPGL